MRRSRKRCLELHIASSYWRAQPANAAFEKRSIVWMDAVDTRSSRASTLLDSNEAPRNCGLLPRNLRRDFIAAVMAWREAEKRTLSALSR